MLCYIFLTSMVTLLYLQYLFRKNLKFLEWWWHFGWNLMPISRAKPSSGQFFPVLPCLGIGFSRSGKHCLDPQSIYTDPYPKPKTLMQIRIWIQWGSECGSGRIAFSWKKHKADSLIFVNILPPGSGSKSAFRMYF